MTTPTPNPLQTPPAGRVFTTRTDPFLARQRKRRDHERDLKNTLKQAETAAENTGKMTGKNTPQTTPQNTTNAGAKTTPKTPPAKGQKLCRKNYVAMSQKLCRVMSHGYVAKIPPLKRGRVFCATLPNPQGFLRQTFCDKTENETQESKMIAKRNTKTPPAKGFTIIEDTREQTPLTFPEGIAVERDTLSTGDYSIRGYENCFAIERKSITDFAGTMMGGYQADTQKPPLRFNNELARLKHFDLAAVIVTATPEELITFHHNCGADAHGALWNFALSIFATHGIPVFMLTDEPTAAKFVADLARHYIAARTKKNRGNAERRGKKSKNGQNPPPEAPEGWDF
jgi:ERCC4-type nuclease